jgi:hypothetical protein
MDRRKSAADSGNGKKDYTHATTSRAHICDPCQMCKKRLTRRGLASLPCAVRLHIVLTMSRQLEALLLVGELPLRPKAIRPHGEAARPYRSIERRSSKGKQGRRMHPKCTAPGRPPLGGLPRLVLCAPGAPPPHTHTTTTTNQPPPWASNWGFNSSVTSCRGSRTRGGAASHSREQIAFPPCAVAHSLNEAIQEKRMSQSVLFLDSSQGSELSLLFLYSRGCIRNHSSRRYAGYD